MTLTPARSYEVNFDGLIGPTHNYGGLSHGNVASKSNALKVSYPKKAAIQGLEKMRYLHRLGLKQGIFLPQQRPYLPELHRLGFRGTDQEIIEHASKTAPELLSNCYSASSMWAANAGTVSPSADSQDGRVHFTAANLCSMYHRSIEFSQTSAMLAAVFDDEQYFAHHSALSSVAHFGDEGAANHNRFAASYGQPGVQLFVYGRYGLRKNSVKAERFPSRQTYEASQAIARLHCLQDERVVFAQQNPDIIDAGAFHNDVVSVSNLDVFFMHEQAFANKHTVLEELQRKLGDVELNVIEVPTEQVSLSDAVRSYLFNSQLIQLPDQSGHALILPTESRDTPAVSTYLDTLLASGGPIKEIKFVNVRQSMQNGGGPACLRLRVALTEQEFAAVNPRFLVDDALIDRLIQWVEAHYRDELTVADFADPQLAQESFTALDELTRLFDLDAFYPFQKVA